MSRLVGRAPRLTNLDFRLGGGWASAAPQLSLQYQEKKTSVWPGKNEPGPGKGLLDGGWLIGRWRLVLPLVLSAGLRLRTEVAAAPRTLCPEYRARLGGNGMPAEGSRGVEPDARQPGFSGALQPHPSALGGSGLELGGSRALKIDFNIFSPLSAAQKTGEFLGELHVFHTFTPGQPPGPCRP